MDDTQEIANPPIFRAVAASGYNGYIGHEFYPMGDPIEALRSAACLGQSGAGHQV